MMKTVMAALALTLSTAAVAAEPRPAPKPECACCKGEKMACCDKKAQHENDEHGDQDMPGMSHE